MLSKWYPWDYKNDFVQLVQSEQSLVSLSSFDSFMEKMLSDQIREMGKEYSLIFGSEVTRDWIENNLLALDLFSSNEAFVIKLPETMPKDVFNYLKELDSGQMQKRVILSFVGAHKYFTELGKNKSWNCLQVQAPRFWEGQKYFEFLMKEQGIHLSYEVQSTILKLVEPTTLNLIHILHTISLYFPGNAQQCRPVDVKNLLTASKLDQFQLASMFGARKMRDLYKELLQLDLDYDSMRGFFSFMQGHIIKMIDPSYTKGKARPSKYDREIAMASKGWSGKELSAYLKLFGKLEIEAKKRSPELKGFLRQLYLKQL